MLRTYSAVPRGSTGESSRSQMNQLPFTTQFSKMLTQSSPHVGVVSQHSFFSRHNPHPNRVRHIQGLNGRPICTVRDDWFVSSSLFPHPLLKCNIIKKAAKTPFSVPWAQNLNGSSGNKNKSAFFSEAWRDELKELAAKVSQSSETQKDNKEGQREEGVVRRSTMYSAETGRIIPPSTTAYQRKSQFHSLKYPQPFHDAELMVFELLCQILQTDSLSTVQQWLLLAGQREKELVMEMIKNALDGVDLSGRKCQSFHPLQVFHSSASSPAYGASFEQPWRRAHRTSSGTSRTNQTLSNEKPERIGGAEILEVHKTA